MLEEQAPSVTSEEGTRTWREAIPSSSAVDEGRRQKGYRIVLRRYVYGKISHEPNPLFSGSHEALGRKLLFL